MSIYLDFNATTPIDDRVRNVMMKWLMKDGCGNPSSPYTIGKVAKNAIERAREQLRVAIGASKGKRANTGAARCGGGEGNHGESSVR